MKTKPSLRISIAVVALLTTTLSQTVSVHCAVDNSTSENLSDNTIGGGSSQTAGSNLPECPAAGIPMLKPSSHTGHHTVTLSWKPSLTSNYPGGAAVGYCLYRGTKENVAKNSFAKPNAQCKECEQINATAVPSTACLDNLVEDGATYYYVVTAINAEGNTSSSSDEARAHIPDNQPAATSSQNSYASCRPKPAAH